MRAARSITATACRGLRRGLHPPHAQVAGRPRRLIAHGVAVSRWFVGEVSGDETVRAHDVYEITLEVTEQHIYGSGGVSVCYQFDVQAFDLSFGIW